jgi:hypothetical protein
MNGCLPLDAEAMNGGPFFFDMISSLTIFLTAALLLVTALYAYFTFRILQANRAAVGMMAEQIKSSLRPYVYFDLVPTHSVLIEARIRNTGKTAAHDVHVVTDPQLHRFLRGESSRAKITHNAIALLPPDREIEEYLSSWADFEKRHGQLEFIGEISYSDSTGNTYKESFRIDLSTRKEMAHIGRPEIAQEVKKIAETLSDIKRHLQR